jgi:hypothetical protein
MTDPASPPPPPRSQRPDSEGIEEIVLCSDDGQVLYEWLPEGAGGHVSLFDPIFKSSDSLTRIFSLGRPRRLTVETLDARLILVLQPNRRLLVRSSVKRRKA